MGNIIVIEQGLLEMKIVPVAEKVVGLSVLQDKVGGYIELLPLIGSKLKDANIDVFVDEEGLAHQRPYTVVMVRKINGIYDGSYDYIMAVAGNIVFAGRDDKGNTLCLTDDQIKLIQRCMSNEMAVFNGCFVRVFEAY